MINKIHWFWLLLLSFLCFNLAFLCPDSYGWCILFFIVPLIPLFISGCNVPRSSWFLRGALWGLMVYSAHFYWLFDVFVTKSHVGYSISLFAFLIPVIWFSFLSSLWFYGMAASAALVTGRCKKIMIILLATCGYFVFIDYGSLTPFVGRIEGYSFISPLIPLTHYNCVQRALSMYGSYCCGFIPLKQTPCDVDFIYLTPPNWDDAFKPALAASIIVDRMKEVVQQRKGNKKPYVVVASESCFPFSLHHQPGFADALNQLLESHIHLMFGALRKNSEKTHQTIFCLRSQGTIFYDKEHLITGVETLPGWLGNAEWAKKPFLEERNPLAAGSHSRFDKAFVITPQVVIVPIICSEFFFLPLRCFYTRNPSQHLVLFFNDSWFNASFCEIAYRLARIRSLILNREVRLVGHKGMYLFH